MKAIILAAGRSSRLYPLTRNLPKCLLKIGDQRIIDTQIRALLAHGVRGITIVVGFKAEKIMHYLTERYTDANFTFIYNPIYHKTNTIYSLWLARNELSNEILYFNADVLLHTEIVKQLINSKYKTVLAVTRGHCGDEEVKVIVNSLGRIERIGKKLPRRYCTGEFIGVAKFGKEFNRYFLKWLDQAIIQKRFSLFFEWAIDQAIQRKAKIYEEDVSGLPAIEIDFLEDLEKARREILPFLR